MAKRQRSHARRGPRATEQPDDAVRGWSEWLDHQYDPGYYVGGRVPPRLRRTGRRSPYGYVLLVTGGIVAAPVVISAVRGAGVSLPGPAVVLVIAALSMGAGLRLVRPRR
ncbi:MAG TPA: hypothetical protein VFN57_10420 [Thermomicrobiaceae bacterium]|nr:hypothetical protein [Thermomicrobiaceae bacterium]